MSGYNLPPGVSVRDLPGNGPEQGEHSAECKRYNRGCSRHESDCICGASDDPEPKSGEPDHTEDLNAIEQEALKQALSPSDVLLMNVSAEEAKKILP